MKNAAHLLNARDVLCSVVSAGGVQEGKQLTSKMNAIPKLPYPTLPSPCHVWLVCLFACAELNVLLSTLFWLPWQIAACCLAMLERVCICVCICVSVCVRVY